MLEEIEKHNFSWEYYENDLDGLNDYLSMFLGIG